LIGELAVHEIIAYHNPEARKPRRYFLRGWFIASEIESGDDEGYRWRISGQEAHFVTPMVDITSKTWFLDLRRSQGNFAFGLQAIRDTRFVRGLNRASAARE
jgi:hypothetical protein